VNKYPRARASCSTGPTDRAGGSPRAVAEEAWPTRALWTLRHHNRGGSRRLRPRRQPGDRVTRRGAVADRDRGAGDFRAEGGSGSPPRDVVLAVETLIRQRPRTWCTPAPGPVGSPDCRGLDLRAHPGSVEAVLHALDPGPWLAGAHRRADHAAGWTRSARCATQAAAVALVRGTRARPTAAGPRNGRDGRHFGLGRGFCSTRHKVTTRRRGGHDPPPAEHRWRGRGPRIIRDQGRGPALTAKPNTRDSDGAVWGALGTETAAARRRLHATPLAEFVTATGPASVPGALHRGRWGTDRRAPTTLTAPAGCVSKNFYKSYHPAAAGRPRRTTRGGSRPRVTGQVETCGCHGRRVYDLPLHSSRFAVKSTANGSLRSPRTSGGAATFCIAGCTPGT